MKRKKYPKNSAQAKAPETAWDKLDVVNRYAAGIDIGGSEHWVAMNPELDGESVRCFDCFTADVSRMADWLWERGVRTVAMQSTGSYWLGVFEILQRRGLEVYLVNARHTKNLPGRKSDIQECQWLLKLHTFGLLNNSFQPTDEIRQARSLWRHRGGLVAQASSAIQRMRKAMVEMNIQLGTVLSDLSGVSGMRIIEAILEGQRDRYRLAALADPQVKATKEVIAKSLEANWREELLFVLRQELMLYRMYQQQIVECDQELESYLRDMEPKAGVDLQRLGPRPKGKRARGNAPQFDLRAELYRTTGIDFAQVDGIDVQTAGTVVFESGIDLSQFKTEKHFAAWLGLAPMNETSGGKVLNRRTPQVVNRATTAFRQAATTLLRSQSYLGAQYRRLRTRLGAPKAITAMARKLSCLFFRLMTHGQQYVDKGAEYYEQRHREQQIRQLLKKAKLLGVQVVMPTPTNA